MVDIGGEHLRLVTEADVEEFVAAMLKYWRWQVVSEQPFIKQGSMDELVDQLIDNALLVEIKTTHADTRQVIRNKLTRMGLMKGEMGEWELITIPWDQFVLYVRLDRE